MPAGVPALHPEEKGRLNISPRANYIEKRGGLPAYINSIAVALVRKGMTRSRAIATARNSVKKTCATGYWGGNPKMPVSAAVRAAACSANVHMKAIDAGSSLSDQARTHLELSREWAERGSLELAWETVKRRRIELAFTEQLHPRTGKGKKGGGRFAKKGAGNQPLKTPQRGTPQEQTRHAHARDTLAALGGIDRQKVANQAKREKRTGLTYLARQWNRMPAAKRKEAMMAFHRRSTVTLPPGWRFTKNGKIVIAKSALARVGRLLLDFTRP